MYTFSTDSGKTFESSPVFFSIVVIFLSNIFVRKCFKSKITEAVVTLLLAFLEQAGNILL